MLIGLGGGRGVFYGVADANEDLISRLCYSVVPEDGASLSGSDRPLLAACDNNPNQLLIHDVVLVVCRNAIT